MSYFISVSDTVRDHYLEASQMRYLKVILDVSSTPLTLYPIRISCDANESYQRWQAQIKNRDVYSVGAYANTEAQVAISHNSSDWVTIFTGFVSDEGMRRQRGLVTDDYVSFELVDATKRKGTRRKPPRVLLTGFKICDPANTSASILHYLADLMGVTLNASEIDQTKTLVELGSNTAWGELQKVQQAYHADMYFDADGELLFISPFDTGYAAPTAEWTFQGDPDNAVSGAACRIKGTLEEVYLPVRCNYAKAQIEELDELSSQVIYKNTESLDTVTDLISISVGAGEYWPGPNSGDVAKLNYMDPESGEKFEYAASVDTPSIGATGSGNDIEHTGGTLEIISFNGSTSATSQGADHSQIILRNTGGETCTIRKLTITGTPYRITSDTTVECIDSAVSDAVDYVEHEIDGKYAIDKSQIYDTLYYLKEEGKGRPRQFRFSAPFMPWIQRNAIVNVQPPGDSSVRCRIDTYQHKNKGRTLQGMYTTIVCTELGSHTPSGDPTTKTDNKISPILAKITSISPNAGATYRSEASSEPTNPQLGDLWYQTDTQLMKRYSGSSWENTGASPLEESESVGVDFENSSGNVQILSDGTLKAIDGEFSGTVYASDGEFTGNVNAKGNILIEATSNWIISSVTAGTTTKLKKILDYVILNDTHTYNSIMIGSVRVNMTVSTEGGDHYEGYIRIKEDGVQVWVSSYINRSGLGFQSFNTNIDVDTGKVYTVEFDYSSQSGAKGWSDMQIDESLGSVALAALYAI